MTALEPSTASQGHRQRILSFGLSVLEHLLQDARGALVWVGYFLA